MTTIGFIPVDRDADLDLDRELAQDCPQCATQMLGIRGSKYAVCPNCGFKDSCCF